MRILFFAAVGDVAEERYVAGACLVSFFVAADIVAEQQSGDGSLIDVCCFFQLSVNQRTVP